VLQLKLAITVAWNGYLQTIRGAHNFITNIALCVRVGHEARIGSHNKQQGFNFWEIQNQKCIPT
jgi:hypothetical protein